MLGLAKLEEKNPRRQMIQRGRQLEVSVVVAVVVGPVAVVVEEQRASPRVVVVAKGGGKRSRPFDLLDVEAGQAAVFHLLLDQLRRVYHMPYRRACIDCPMVLL